MASLASSLSAADWQLIDGVVQASDPSQVDAGWLAASLNFPQDQWLSIRHVMRNPRTALKGSTLPFTGRVFDRVAEYAATSVALHLADSFSYFSRAMSALAAGASEIAQHLFYYSELRAATAILARHGILIQNYKNFVLSPSAAAVKVPISDGRIANNAHQALWVLFASWSRGSQATDFCGDEIRVAGSSLQDWVDGRDVFTPLSSVWPSLLENWGFDLERFGSDRDLRNHLSYDPTRLDRSASSLPPAEVASLLEDVWSLFEPQRLNPFENLDVLLFRQTMEALHAVHHPSSSSRRASTYRAENLKLCSAVLGPGRGAYLADFLQRPYSAPEPVVLKLANVDPSSSKSLGEKVVGMAGRSIILLRFATAALRNMLARTGTTSVEIDFWLVDLLTQRGISVPTGTPRHYEQMHVDVLESLRELAPLSALRSVSDLPHAHDKFGGQLNNLTGFERVAAWSVA